MPLTTFDNLPDNARLWAFAAQRDLEPKEIAVVSASVGEFLASWAAHGEALTAGFKVLHDRFLLVGVDDDETRPSGCSIDAMTRHLKEVRNRLGVDFLGSPDCCYRLDSEIRTVDRPTFKGLVEVGDVDAETVVFDLTTPTVGDLRNGRFETVVGESWYGRAFSVKQPAA